MPVVSQCLHQSMYYARQAASWLLVALVMLFTSMFAVTGYAKTATAVAVESATATASASAEAIPANVNTNLETDELIVLDRVLKQNGQDIPVLGGVANTATAGVLNDDEKPQSRTAVVDDKTPASNAAEKASDDLYLNEPVVDEARVLLASDKAALEQKLRSWHHQGLAQAAIVIVSTTGFEPIFDYGMKIVDRWKLGTKKNDNGLLILVAVNDRKMHIFTGYGVEGVIPDVMAKRIIRDDITPYFKKRQYANGLMSGLNAIEKRLTTDPAILAQADENRQLNKSQQGDAGGGVSLGLMLFALILGSVLTAIFGRFLGSLATAGGFTVLSLMSGAAMGATLFGAFFVFFLTLVGFFNLFAGGGRGGHIGGGGFGGGDFGGGGFGGGGFGGGGGGFGGGGAGGSW